MSSKIVVTGIGIISSIGNNTKETLDALVNRRSGIGSITILDTIHKNDFVLGEIKLTHDELMHLAKVDPQKPWTRTALLAIIAARQAIQDAKFDTKDSENMGLISATTVGGMDRSELFYKDFLGKDEANPYIDTHHAGDSTEKVAGELHINGYISTISTACSSSLNSMMFGARLIKHGIVDKVVVGGTDALSKFTINGFNTLMILDKELCRPFDETRTGLNLGEGAAYLVLEKEESAIKDNKHIYAELSGYANANDAFHQTASSEEGTGPFLAMENALKTANLKPSEIDYINVHGTGTENNDLTEGKAMIRLFGENMPAFSSTKSYTGHTLGAAGVIESIFSILSLQHSKIFPNLNFKQKCEEFNLIPETELTELEIDHVLTNSFGFGGNDSSVVFSIVQDTRPKTEDLRLENQESRTKNQDSKPGTRTPKPAPPVFINGIGAVSPIETIGADFFDTEIPETDENFLQIIKPNFREYISPKDLRRMSKIVRMGLVAAKVAMKDAAVEQPDAIITGTGMGCQVDTEKFLNSMLDNDETLLTPTSFIQSTHNTIGAQIALMLGNHNYNFTFVHRTFSFESALLDSILQIEEKKTAHILLGGVDEITEESWLIKTRIGYFKKETTPNFDLLNDQQEGALAGESASFFILSGEKTKNTYAQVLGVETFFKPGSQEIIAEKITSFLSSRGLKSDDIDLVLLGYNGDPEFDQIYHKTEDRLFQNNTIGYYKHLCGEHDTSSSFAMWLASGILKSGNIPTVLIQQNKSVKRIEKVLIYSQFRNINHSLILLEKA